MSSLYSIAHQFNPDSLRVAREFRGLQKKDLAELIGVTPSALTQFENGTSRPNAQTVGRVSMALSFPITFFALSEIKPIASDHCHFRSLSSSSLAERRRMASAGTLLGRVVDYIDGYINLPPEQLSLSTSSTVDSPEEIEEYAIKLRKDWGLGLGPIDNMTRLLESKGVLIFRLLSDCKRVDGFSTWHKGRPLIFLNSEKGCATRSRLDIGHEMAHLILHSDCIPGDHKHEVQAFRLGAAFLFPRDSFLREFPRRLVWPHLFEIKMRWKISLAALVRRARDLGIYSEATYKRASQHITSQGWRTREPYEPEIERPSILSRSIDLIKQTNKSLASIAEEVGMFERDLADLVYADDNDFNPECSLKTASLPSTQTDIV